MKISKTTDNAGKGKGKLIAGIVAGGAAAVVALGLGIAALASGKGDEFVEIAEETATDAIEVAGEAVETVID